MRKMGLIAIVLVILIVTVPFAALANEPVKNEQNPPSNNLPPGPGPELMVSRPQPGGPNPEPRPEMRKPECQPPCPPFGMADLNLTFDQQLKMLEIRQAFARESQPLRFIIEKDQLQLGQLWSEKTLNQKQIEEKETEVALTRVKIRLLERRLTEQLNVVLTPEQQKQLQNNRPGPKPPECWIGQKLS